MGIIIKDGIEYGNQQDMSGKVDKVTGKGLSTNDYTNADKQKLDGIAAGAQVNTITGVKGDAESSYRTGNVSITPANIGAYTKSETDNAISQSLTTKLDTASIRIYFGNASEFTYSGLNAINRSSYKHGLLIWGIGNAQDEMGLSLIFIDVNGNVTIRNVAGTSRTFSGAVQNGNLIITSDQTVYGGLKLIWLT